MYYPLSSADLRVTNSADGDSINGFYITNNAYALSSMLNGDGMAKPFKKGDYFKVTVKGYNGTALPTAPTTTCSTHGSGLTCARWAR